MAAPRVIDKGLLPSEGPPVAVPLRMVFPPVRSEPDLPAVPVSQAEEQDMSDLPVVLDPVGRSEMVEGRLLTEAMFFRLGFARATDSEMAGMVMASVLWVTAVMQREVWLQAAYDAGYAARDREGVRLADRSLDKLVEGYVQDQQKVTKDGDVVDFQETVGASLPAVQFKLSALAKGRYGKDAKEAPRGVSVGVMVSVNDRLRAAGETEVRVAVAD